MSLATPALDEDGLSQRPDAEIPWPRPTIAWWAIVMLALAYCISILDRVALGFMIGPIEADLHITDTQMGLLQGAGFALFFAFLGYPVGVLADRVNRKLLIALGMVVWSLATIGCGMASSFIGLFLARVIVGSGEAVLTPGGTSLIGDLFSPDQRPRAFSVYSLGSSLGAGLAFLFIASALQAVTRFSQGAHAPFIHLHPWQWMFVLLGLPGLISAGLFLLTVAEPPRRETLRGDVPVAMGPFFKHMRTHAKAYAGLFGAGMASSVATYVTIGWFPTFIVRAYGMTPAATAGLMGIIGLPCGLASSLLGGWIIGEFYRRGRLDGPVIISAVSLTVVAIGSAIEGFSTSFPLALVGYTVIGLSMNMPIVAILTGINRITPNRMRAQALAIFALFTSLVSQIAGPLAIGALAQHVFKGNHGVGYGIVTVISVSCILAIIVVIAYRGHFNRAEQMMRQ
jgi:MFS family permease